MHLAEMFQGKPADCRLWVHRRWPLIDNDLPNHNFYKYPSEVGYDAIRRAFVVYEHACQSSEIASTYDIDPKFLGDRAWRVCKTNSGDKKFLPDEKNFDLAKARKTHGYYQHRTLQVVEGILHLNDPPEKKLTFLRL